MRPLRFIRRLKRKIRKYTRKYGYNPLRAIAREREKMKFVHLGMRLARRQEPKTTLEIALQKPEVSPYSTGIWSNIYLAKHPELNRAHIEQSDTARIADIQAQTARELQRHLDEKRNEPPQQNTEPHRFHAFHLQRIRTEEMPAMFPMRDTDKWLVR